MSKKKTRVTTFLSQEDYVLFERATKLYDKVPADLAREILHFWLFNNQLQLEQKK